MSKEGELKVAEFTFIGVNIKTILGKVFKDKVTWWTCYSREVLAMTRYFILEKMKSRP